MDIVYNIIIIILRRVALSVSAMMQTIRHVLFGQFSRFVIRSAGGGAKPDRPYGVMRI